MTPILITIAIGLVAGFLAGIIMKRGRFGLVGNLIVGFCGGLLGSFLTGLIGLGAYGIIAQIVVAVIGACILLWLFNLMKE